MNIRWFDKVRNKDLWQRAYQDGMDLINTQIKKRKWAWIGHTLRKPPNSITRQALKWNPQDKRSRGRPRNTWHRHRVRIERAGTQLELGRKTSTKSS
jgi:hypothetical protein